MNRFRPAGLLLALLTGCAATSKPPAEEPSPFVLPAGAPRNVRIGFVQGYPPGSRAAPVLLIPGAVVQDKLTVVSRDARLDPTAVLEIAGVSGHIAVARIVRGEPQPKDEVVLPSTELSERARRLRP